MSLPQMRCYKSSIRLSSMDQIEPPQPTPPPKLKLFLVPPTHQQNQSSQMQATGVGPSHYPQQAQAQGCFLSHPSLPMRLVPQAGTSPLMTKPGTWAVCSSPFSSPLSHKILLLPLGKKNNKKPQTLAYSHSQGQIPSRPNPTPCPLSMCSPGVQDSVILPHTYTDTHTSQAKC